MTTDKEPAEEEQTYASEGEQIGALKEQLEEALREKDQFRSLAQRAQADLVNYKRRVEEERVELQRSANAGLILKLVSVVDDFHLALSHIPSEDINYQWLEGVQLIQRKLEALMESEGVSRIEAEGREFDPWEHEALFFEESPGAQGGKVLKVIRQGYKLHDRVLRPAQVTVSKPKATEQEAPASDTREEA